MVTEQSADAATQRALDSIEELRKRMLRPGQDEAAMLIRAHDALHGLLRAIKHSA